MRDDLIRRSDAIGACAYETIECYEARKAIRALPSADRPSEIIYGNEHNCMMTIFGECSYAETGCGDCAVVEKVRKALSADRPQGEWIYHRELMLDKEYYPSRFECDQCHHYVIAGNDRNFCPNCGARMKGADDE